jgi:hypothetical protein
MRDGRHPEAKTVARALGWCFVFVNVAERLDCVLLVNDRWGDVSFL